MQEQIQRQSKCGGSSPFDFAQGQNDTDFEVGLKQLAGLPTEQRRGEQGFWGRSRRDVLVCGDDELYVGLAAHAVDGTGPTGSGGVLVASGFFGHSGDGAVRAADDGSRRIKRRCGAKVDDEAYVFAGALELDRCSGFEAEERVALGVGDAGSGRSRVGGASDVNGTRGRC